MMPKLINAANPRHNKKINTTTSNNKNNEKALGASERRKHCEAKNFAPSQTPSWGRGAAKI